MCNLFATNLQKTDTDTRYIICLIFSPFLFSISLDQCFPLLLKIYLSNKSLVVGAIVHGLRNQFDDCVRSPVFSYLVTTWFMFISLHDNNNTEERAAEKMRSR